MRLIVYYRLMCCRMTEMLIRFTSHHNLYVTICSVDNAQLLRNCSFHYFIDIYTVNLVLLLFLCKFDNILTELYLIFRYSEWCATAVCKMKMTKSAAVLYFSAAQLVDSNRQPLTMNDTIDDSIVDVRHLAICIAIQAANYRRRIVSLASIRSTDDR